MNSLKVALATVLVAATIGMVVILLLVLFKSEEYVNYLLLAVWVSGMAGVAFDVIESKEDLR